MFETSRAMDFEVRMDRMAAGQALVVVSLPYSQIWFKSREDRLETVIEVKMNRRCGRKESPGGQPVG